ncbi:MAG: hypothetical protein WBW33_34580 [Bryobacteraceae bacterium]
MDETNDLLRHTVATVAYRGGKALRGAPEGFAETRAGEGARSAGEILAHVGDLFDWAVSLVEGRQTWKDSKPLPWNEEVARFHASLTAFDEALVKKPATASEAERLFQGPIADALTHIGQIAQLRRLAGSHVRPENYHQAEIAKGRTGPDQVPAKREF